MKKTISLVLNQNDPFYKELLNTLNEAGELGIGGFETSKVASKVANATIITLMSELSVEGVDTSKITKYKFESEESVYPHFHHALEEHIDIALNRRVHTTTLERLAEIVENFMVSYADKQEEEKKIKINPLVNPENEIKYIIDYISKTWDGFDTPETKEGLIKVWDSANNLLKNQFDQYIFLNFMKHLYDFKDFSPVSINGVNSQELPLYFILSNSALHDSVQKSFDYSKSVRSILSSIKTEISELTKVKPKGWNAFSKDYIDYQGMSDLDHNELKILFNGMDSGTAGCSSFEVRTALPHVMYDDKCQGRKPLEVLVGAMLTHAYVMNEKNNGSKMLKEWVDLKKQIEENPRQNIDFEFKESLNQALFHVIKNEGEVKPGALKMLGIGKTKVIKP